MSCALIVTDTRNFVTNHFVVCYVHCYMGSFAQVASRLPELRMTIVAVRAILADSSSSARQHLRQLLASEGGVEVIAECTNSQETLAAIQLQKPDLVFLDVHLADCSGFELLQRIPLPERPFAIFVSSDPRYAMQAFEARALDYLPKPLDPRRLHAAIERTRMELLRVHDRRLTHQLLGLLAGSTPETSNDRRLVVKSGGRVIFLDMDEIEWVEAAGNYVKLHVAREAYVMREAISRISERLDPAQFARIHRSIIVNVRKIKALQPCNRGEYMVILKNGKELSCSRGYRARLQQLIAVA